MRRRVILLCVAAAAATAARAQTPQPPWEKNHLRIGQALYRENCVVCHDIDRAVSRKSGPSFFRLFKQDRMPLSNMKPDRAYIKVRVKFGGNLMPAFQRSLTDREIDALIDYIASK
jgi:mono/diheme cytochrome c family protein